MKNEIDKIQEKNLIGGSTKVVELTLEFLQEGVVNLFSIPGDFISSLLDWNIGNKNCKKQTLNLVPPLIYRFFIVILLLRIHLSILFDSI